ncbi:MAG: hypothetical protein JW740_00870 [Candidatus Zambryskibacteria bacterium]|nr:hypothetical protein [Candidatus Zambryskibacteria bacterium]
MNDSKASAKDFFLHLGAIVALYASVISFLNLVFKIINNAWPEVGRNIYDWGNSPEISMPVATLIVVFPIFIILSRMVRKIYMISPEKKELGIRKWLTYITLFVAGIILASDLVYVIFKFLDGQDLTGAFLLKALSVLIVAAGIFWYYLQDIRDKISSKCMRTWVISSIVLVILAIILGFAVIGSPKKQRMIREDAQKITDLQNLQWQVISYWQTNGMIPETSEVLKNYCARNYCLPNDNFQDYEYHKTGILEFELCTDFNYGITEDQNIKPIIGPKTSIIQNENWNHGPGNQCFERVIDSIAYPTNIRG